MNKSNNGFILLSAVFLLTLFNSCSKDRIDSEQVKSDILRMNMSIDNSFQKDFTAIPEELQIKDVIFMFYDKKSDAYLGHATPVVSENNGSLELPTPNFLEPETSYKVLIAANLLPYIKEDDYDSFAREHASLSYSSMQFMMAATTIDEKRVISPLPFSGKLIGPNLEESLFYFNRNSSETNVSVKFTRGVARFDLQCLAPNLEIKWAKVANYRNQVYLHSEYIGGEIISKVDSEGSIPQGSIEIPYEEGKPQTLKGGLYAFPNLVRNINQHDKETTCLLIYGSYNNLPPTYYRINIGYDKGVQRLRPNHIYKLTITRVESNGAETESEALYNSKINIDYNINESWDEESKLEVDKDGNYLGVSSNYVLLGFTENEREEIKVNTHKGAKWKVELVESEKEQFCEIINQTAYSFVIKTKSENFSSEFRNNHLIVSVEGSDLKQEVLVLQNTIYEITHEKNIERIEIGDDRRTFPFVISPYGSRFLVNLYLESSIPGENRGWEIVPNEALLTFSTINSLKGKEGDQLVITMSKNTSGLGRIYVFTAYPTIGGERKSLGYEFVFTQNKLN